MSRRHPEALEHEEATATSSTPVRPAVGAVRQQRLHRHTQSLAAAAAPQASSVLTEREHHILHLIGEGLSSPQIAERLNYSVSTISENTMAMYRKLGLTDRSDAITLVHPSHLP